MNFFKIGKTMYIDEKTFPNQKNSRINSEKLKSLKCKQNRYFLEVIYNTELIAVINFKDSIFTSVTDERTRIYQFSGIHTLIDGNNVRIVISNHNMTIENVMSSDLSNWLQQFLKISYECAQYQYSTI